MAEKKKRIKLHALGSLTQRAVFISLCLLVMPLFFHSLFLYWREHQIELSDIEQDLQIIAKAQRALLEERMEIQWRILDAALGSQETVIERFHILQIPLPSKVSGYFAVASQKEDALLVGRQISENEALVIGTPFELLFNQLTEFTATSYPISIALIDADGAALAGAKQETALSVTLPIQGAQFLFYLSIPEGALEELHAIDYFYQFLVLLLFVGGFGGILVAIATRRIARPLRQLCHIMECVGEGGVHVRYEPDRMGFEINELGKQFNETLDQLLRHQQAAEAERIARERLAEELKIGHDIQGSLFPSQLPEMQGLKLAAGFLPALEVGGDFYDLFPLKDGKCLIAIADTAGKGVSACLYSLGLRSSLRSLASVCADLSEIVLRANDLFLRDAQQSGIFVTLWIGLYDIHTNVLEYCNQGHPPAYLLRNGECHPLTTGGMALGVEMFQQIFSEKIHLSPNDILFLYTDGVIEAHDVNHQLFGAQRLEAFLNRSQHLAVPQIVEALLKEVGQFACGAPQHDDLTLLILEIEKNSPIRQG